MGLKTKLALGATTKTVGFLSDLGKTGKEKLITFIIAALATNYTVEFGIRIADALDDKEETTFEYIGRRMQLAEEIEERHRRIVEDLSHLMDQLEHYTAVPDRFREIEFELEGNWDDGLERTLQDFLHWAGNAIDTLIPDSVGDIKRQLIQIVESALQMVEYLRYKIDELSVTSVQLFTNSREERLYIFWRLRHLIGLLCGLLIARQVRTPLAEKLPKTKKEKRKEVLEEAKEEVIQQMIARALKEQLAKNPELRAELEDMDPDLHDEIYEAAARDHLKALNKLKRAMNLPTDLDLQPQEAPAQEEQEVEQPAEEEIEA